MNNQFFQRWQIDGVANEKYDVDSIAWTSEGLVFVVVPDGKAPDSSVQKLSLIWESSSVISYHVTDETYRPDCWGLDFEANGRFYATTASEYIDKLKDNSTLIPDRVIHFTIVGTNTIVDLLAKDDPKAKIE